MDVTTFTPVSSTRHPASGGNTAVPSRHLAGMVEERRQVQFELTQPLAYLLSASVPNLPTTDLVVADSDD